MSYMTSMTSYFSLQVTYALSIGTNNNDLGWPWTAETSLLQK